MLPPAHEPSEVTAPRPGRLVVGATTVEWDDAHFVVRTTDSAAPQVVKPATAVRLQVSRGFEPARPRWWWRDRAARQWLQVEVTHTRLRVALRAPLAADDPRVAALPRLDNQAATVVALDELEALLDAARFHGAAIPDAPAPRADTPSPPVPEAEAEAEAEPESASMPWWRTLRFAYVLWGLIFAATSIGGLWYVLSTYLDHQDWVERTCEVIETRVESNTDHERLSYAYTVVFRLRAAGHVDSEAFSAGGYESGHEATREAEAMLGSHHPCWLDPDSTDPPLDTVPTETAQLVLLFLVLPAGCATWFCLLAQRTATRKLRQGLWPIEEHSGGGERPPPGSRLYDGALVVRIMGVVVLMLVGELHFTILARVLGLGSHGAGIGLALVFAALWRPYLAARIRGEVTLVTSSIFADD